MSQFLEAARRVLSAEARPLSPREITSLALEHGWLETEGKTPSQTMKSKLSMSILKDRDKSLFMRVAPGEFGLREWLQQPDGPDEYIADRYQKALLEEDVVVFDATHLDEFITQPGELQPPSTTDSDLTDLCYARSRNEAEEDPSVIQLVSAFVVRYADTVLTYKRTKRLPEQRLHHQYSLMFGGHLNPDDIPPLFDIFDPSQGAPFLERELSEELILPVDQTRQFLYRGLLYDDSRPVSQQHLGIVYDVILEDDRYKIGERGFLMDASFESLQEIRGRSEDFENWSLIILDSLEAELHSAHI